MADDMLVRFMFTYRSSLYDRTEYDIASTEAIAKANRDWRQKSGCRVGDIVRVEMPLPKEPRP